MKIKKAFLRFLSGLMAACMLILSGSGFAAVNNQHIFTYEQTEVIISGSVDYGQASLVANAIIGNEEIGVAQSSILCIFGHNIIRTSGWEITHRYWATTPRCRRRTIDVFHCSRCDHIRDVVIVSTIRISCC